MDLASLPTDNLYKFLALSGLTIILFFTYLNVRYRSGLWARLDAVRRKQARINAEHEALETENEYLKALGEAVKGGTPDQTRDVLSKRDILRERFGKLKDLSKTTEIDVAAILRIEGQLRWLNRISLAAIVVGLAMASSGFALWYYRVQVYEDQELRLKAVQPPDTTHGTIH